MNIELSLKGKTVEGVEFLVTAANETGVLTDRGIPAKLYSEGEFSPMEMASLSGKPTVDYRFGARYGLRKKISEEGLTRYEQRCTILILKPGRGSLEFNGEPLQELKPKRVR